MAFKLGQRGQMTVYVADDNVEPLLTFAAEHPIASASDITNAALRYYLPLAIKGVDGRLRPLHGPNGPETQNEEIRSLLNDLVNKLQEQRRVVWTDEQRREYTKPDEDPKQRDKHKR